MKIVKHLLTIALVGSIHFLQAQDIPFEKEFFKENKDGLKEAKSNIELGDQKYLMGPTFMRDALPYYEKANTFNPSSSELNMKIGECYLVAGDKVNSLKHLEKALTLNPSLDPRSHYLLGQAYHLNMQWDKAITEYGKYQATVVKSGDPRLLEELKRRTGNCSNGKILEKQPIRVFIDNLGKSINTEYNEYGAVISADESVLMFTARKPDSQGGKMDEYLNENFEDIYISTKSDDGSWTKATNLPKPINTEDHDAVSGLSADGQKLIIYLGRKNNGDLFESKLQGTVWGEPESFGKNINTKDYHESSAAYSPDGNSLYFVSDKPGGIGQHDIYVSVKDVKGNWGEAKNLGAIVNTQFNEEGVYMHPDGKTLFFGSEGHNSMGGYDIFKTVYDVTKQAWGKPENIGFPVNTPDNDVFFVTSADGRHGYYTSINNSEKMRRDLYIITFLGPEKQMVLNNEDNLLASANAPISEIVIAPVIEVKEAQLTILKGVIRDALTKAPLEAEIEIVDNQANSVIATFKSNSTSGKYLVSLPAGKNYGIAVKKTDYLFHSENFDIPATAAFQEVEKDVDLKNLAVGKKIVLKNIFFDTDKATLRPESTNELERLIKLMNDVPSLKIELSGHTDSQGADDYNQGLSERRAKAVTDYLTKAGISADRLKAAGYGETRPIATNENAAGRQLNRRTEFEVLAI